MSANGEASAPDLAVSPRAASAAIEIAITMRAVHHDNETPVKCSATNSASRGNAAKIFGATLTGTVTWVKNGARPDPETSGRDQVPLPAAQTNRARQALVTRERIIDATLASIAEVGYYRTTTNQIARRAGVTWGVIQHHFGSRESLLVAVVEADAEDMIKLFAAAEIVGETLAERVDSWASLALEYFGRVKYISILQILFDLGNDPDATDATRATLAKHARQLDKRMNHVLSLISPDTPLSKELFGFLYQASMGLGTTRGFNLLTHHPKTDQIFAVARRHFVAAVVQYLQSADADRPTSGVTPSQRDAGRRAGRSRRRT